MFIKLIVEKSPENKNCQNVGITPAKSSIFCLYNSKIDNFEEKCVRLRMVSFCFQIVLWGSFDRFLSIFFKKIKILEKIMIFVYQNGAWILVVSEKSIKDYQKSTVSSWYTWHSTTNTEVRKRFYFIRNIKYGSFLKFWAPFQLRTTKTRFCGSSQTFRRNEIWTDFTHSDAFGRKCNFWRNYNLNQKREFLSHKDVRPGVEKLFSQTFETK